MKTLKDPIYGYINIEDDIISDVIDTAEFQRLRQVMQTSYSPLYASSVHNRFVHSLGVYYLGSIVAELFAKSLEKMPMLEEKDKTKYRRYIEVFKLACIMHDIGHSPFSHTGEELYLAPNFTREKLHDEIIKLTGYDKRLEKDIEKNGYAAAPHELMSIIVSLSTYENKFYDNEERSFFARCISGYLYNGEDIFYSFLDCMIKMLNSSVIDVDKLDYLIRDSYVTGFDTVSIDYQRLLKSVQIVVSKGKCEQVYSKSAVSVIENVVFARDAEKKWIQNHPTIQYDSYLLKHAMERINDKYNIFNAEALSVTGKKIDDKFKARLLCDSDIIFLMKNINDDKLVDEYFSRVERRHPFWKSEAEYKAYFNTAFGDSVNKNIELELEELSKYLNLNNKSQEINDDALKSLEEDIEKNMALCNGNNNAQIDEQLKSKNRHLKFVKCLKEFAKEQDIDFDFLLLKAQQFNSGFGKIDFEEISIVFPDSDKIYEFGKVANALSAQKSERDKFYYLFYRRKSKDAHIDVSAIATKIAQLAVNEYMF